MTNKKRDETLVLQAVKDRDHPLSDDILAELCLMMGAHYRGDAYSRALHVQKASKLLDRYALSKGQRNA